MTEVSILSKTRWKWTGVAQKKTNLQTPELWQEIPRYISEHVLKQFLEFKLMKILMHFKYEGHWERLLKTIWSRMNAIETSTKPTEHIQLYITMWNFTHVSQEPQPTITIFPKLSPGNAWGRACKDPLSWEEKTEDKNYSGSHKQQKSLQPMRRKWRKKASLFSRGFGRV